VFYNFCESVDLQSFIIRKSTPDPNWFVAKIVCIPNWQASKLDACRSSPDKFSYRNVGISTPHAPLALRSALAPQQDRALHGNLRSERGREHFDVAIHYPLHLLTEEEIPLTLARNQCPKRVIPLDCPASVMMRWRPIRPETLRESLSIYPSKMGHELVGQSKALAAWQWLLKSRSFQAAFVESDKPIKGHGIVGFGASVFVSAAFSDREIADPRPGLNARLIDSIVSRQPVVLNSDELRRGNAQGSLHKIGLQHCWRTDSLTPLECQEVNRQLILAMIHYEDGYRLRRILAEGACSAEIEFIKSLRVFEVLSTFQDFHRQNPGNSWNRDRALFSHIDCVTITIPSSNFSEPVLGFAKGDQELLAYALKGLTDVELSREMGLKLPTVKKRWISVFNRIAMIKPDLLPGVDDNLDRKVRGQQKRHRLLNYLRAHPEELRPYHY
jgi:hypothetical protein